MQGNSRASSLDDRVWVMVDGMRDPHEWRQFVDAELMPHWLVRQEGNRDEYYGGHWNEQEGVSGDIASHFITFAALYKFDGTDAGTPRQGFLIGRSPHSSRIAQSLQMALDHFGVMSTTNPSEVSRLSEEPYRPKDSDLLLEERDAAMAGRKSRRERTVLEQRSVWLSSQAGYRRDEDSLPLELRRYRDMQTQPRLGRMLLSRERVSTEDFFGMEEEELCPAHHAFFRNQSNHGYRQATVLRERDLSSNKYGRRTKHPHSARSSNVHGSMMGIKRSLEVPNSERNVADLYSMQRACEKVYAGAAAQAYRHSDPEINSAVQIVLRYIQSRRDRKKPVDMTAVMNMRDDTLNYRLGKWEALANHGIVSMRHLLAGVFYGQKAVHVSSGYAHEADRYVVSQNDLLRATRQVLSGTVDIGYFNVLDPRSRAILEYAQQMRELSDGGRTPKASDIAYARVPELRQQLEQRGLMHKHPMFVF